MVPPPQEPVKPLGVEITKPDVKQGSDNKLQFLAEARSYPVRKFFLSKLPAVNSTTV
jgi:hypothetical protein